MMNGLLNEMGLEAKKSSCLLSSVGPSSPQARLCKEEDLLHGIFVGYSYDRVGRCTQYSVNGTPCVEYEYRNGHLTDVIRKNASGNEMYRHRYTEIDCEEKVVESALTHDLGTATVAWDRMGRVSHSLTPYWEETIPTDGYDTAGNLKETIVRDSIGDASYRYSYDNLYQLIHEEGVFSDDYSFDSICNRLKKNDASYQVNSQGNCMKNPLT